MAPGLRSGRTGHPEVVVLVVVGAGGADPGGCSPQRTDAGGEGRCLKTRLRTGAAGMLAHCLLSMAVLSFVVRCALAAEGKPSTEMSAPACRGTVWFVAFTSFTCGLYCAGIIRTEHWVENGSVVLHRQRFVSFSLAAVLGGEWVG